MTKIKVYTKTGDNGTTGLFSGERVPKHHIRIKAYGTVDELNSWIGIIRSQKIKQEQADELIKIQHDLMYIGSELANDSANNKTPGSPPKRVEKEKNLVDMVVSGNQYLSSKGFYQNLSSNNSKLIPNIG